MAEPRIPSQNQGQHPPAIDHAAVAAMHRDFLSALDRELSATIEADQRRAIQLSTGVCIEASPVYCRYQFDISCPLPKRLRHGPHLLLVEGEILRVCLLRSNERSIVIEVSEDLGQSVSPGATIWSDSRWMLEGLIARLTVCSQATREQQTLEPPFHLLTACAAVGMVHPAVPTGKADEIPPSIIAGLNPEQQESVHRAMGRVAHYMWGPPGTGKTTSLGAVCEAHYRRGDSLLITAPSNAAADLLLDAVCVRLQHEAGFPDGLIIRLGNNPTRHLRAEFTEAVGYTHVLERRTHQLRQEISLLEEEDAELTAELDWMRSTDETLSTSSVRAAQQRIRGRTDQLRAQIHELPWSLLRQAKIVGGTMHAAFLSGRLRRDFAAVVIDEVTMASVPAVHVVAGLAREHVTVAGDHMQLPAPLATTDPGAVGTLGLDVFRRAGMANLVDRTEWPENVSVLRTQYRMRPAICDVINQTFYSGLLRSGREPADANKDVAVVLVDTSDLIPRTRRVSGSRENPIHAEIIVRLVARLEARWAALSRPDPEIRIISPYVAQSQLIRARLKHTSPHPNSIIATVHASQGAAADIVVLDLTDARGLPPSGFSLGDSVHAVGPRLMNVAVSRAREHLIVVADCSYIAAHGGRAVRDVLERVIGAGRVVPGRTLLHHETGLTV